MFKEFFHSAVRFKDLEAAERFYTGVLGLKVTRRQPADEWGTEAVFVPGLQLVAAGTNEGPLDHIAVLVDDMDKAIAHLQANGVSMVTPVIERGGGVKVAFCEDPEGHRIELVYRPG